MLLHHRIISYGVVLCTFLLILVMFQNSTPATRRRDHNENEENTDPVSQTPANIDWTSKNQTVLDEETLATLGRLIDCKNSSYEYKIQQRGRYWVLINFVQAEHGQLGCHQTVTYTTHGNFVFLRNLEPLLVRWKNPVSIALFAPGDDFTATVDSIRYLRDCSKTDLVKKYVTFHIYFPADHMPAGVHSARSHLDTPYICEPPIPYMVNEGSVYKEQRELLYPINIGRNVARDASLTHYVLPSDIELYPSMHMPEKFMNMIARNGELLKRTKPRVFPLSIFEVESGAKVPQNKTVLVEMLNNGTAIPFHQKICAKCHSVPRSEDWKGAPETEAINVFHVAKRIGDYYHWEPIFIGTKDDPYYDERLSWEGMKDKMSQGYILCVMDYDFMILDNAFLVHRPGIKTEIRTGENVERNNHLSKDVLYPELVKLYGSRKGCAI